MIMSEPDFKEARELLREMFIEGEISRAEYEAIEPNPKPFWGMIMKEMGTGGGN
jgi:hypothetical protein